MQEKTFDISNGVTGVTPASNIKDIFPDKEDINSVRVKTGNAEAIQDAIIQDLNSRCINIIIAQQEKFKLPFRAMTVGRGYVGVKQSHNILKNLCTFANSKNYAKGLLDTDPQIFSFSENKNLVIQDMHVALELLRAFAKGTK